MEMDKDYTYLIISHQITLHQSAHAELGFSTYERAWEVYQSFLELHNKADGNLTNVTDDWDRSYSFAPNSIVNMHLCRGHQSAKWAADAKKKKEAWVDQYEAGSKLGFGR